MRSINLLPPELARQEAVKRRRLLWVLVGVVYLAVLGYLTYNRQSEVDKAQEAVDAQLAVNNQLETDVARLRGAEDVVADFEAGVGVLIQTLATDVSWGTILNDLGRLIPDRVWLDSFDGSVTGLDESGAIGAITVRGTGFDYPDIAAWLRTFDEDTFPGVAGTWVSSLTRTEVAGVPTFTFSSTTALTVAAISDRIRDRIPGVP